MTFAEHLLAKLRHHLESPTCRYADNSLAYYNSQSEKAQMEDTRWLSINRIPTLKEFFTENKEQLIAVRLST